MGCSVMNRWYSVYRTEMFLNEDGEFYISIYNKSFGPRMVPSLF